MFTFKKLGRYGRIGNQMFQIASTIGIATKHNDSFAFPYWMNWDQKELFGRDEDIDMQKWFKNPLPIVDENIVFQPVGVDWGYHDLNFSPGNWDLAGHMQSEKYFKHCRDLIKHYFTFTQEAIDQANLITPVPQGTVCVQFRRDDYVTKAGYHPPVGKDYYDKCLALFPHDSNFLVFPEANEAECREIMGDRPKVAYIDNIHSMLKIVLASQCSHFILPNGTFFWFPAWLCENPDKIVTVPATWFGPEAGGLPAHDIPAEGWKIL